MSHLPSENLTVKVNDTDPDLLRSLAVLWADSNGGRLRGEVRRVLYRHRILNEKFGGSNSSAINNVLAFIHNHPMREHILSLASRIRSNLRGMGWMRCRSQDGGDWLFYGAPNGSCAFAIAIVPAEAEVDPGSVFHTLADNRKLLHPLWFRRPEIPEDLDQIRQSAERQINAPLPGKASNW